MSKVYRIWCKWNLGLDEYLYGSLEAAEEALEKIDWEDMLCEKGVTAEELIREGLLGIDEEDAVF